MSCNNKNGLPLERLHSFSMCPSPPHWILAVRFLAHSITSGIHEIASYQFAYLFQVLSFDLGAPYQWLSLSIL